MIKLTIVQLGTPKQIQTSKGVAEKNYIKVSEEKYWDKFLNFWINNTTRAWKIGQMVEVDDVEERDYTAKDGSLKKSYDIKLGNKEDRIQKLLEEIASRQVTQGMTLQAILGKLQGKPKDDYPDDYQGEPNFDTHDLPKDLKDENEHNN